MAPRTTLWPLDEHTRGKHLVLREYLQQWLAILGQRPGRLCVVDAFAGPGRYAGGEPGSPLILLQSLAEHSARARIVSDVDFVFVEADPSRHAHLVAEVQESPHAKAAHRIDVRCEAFSEIVPELLRGLRTADTQGLFAMIDPFGVRGVTMQMLRAIMAMATAEIMFSFMVDHVDRFLDGTEFEPHLDALYGGPEWRDALSLPRGGMRREVLFQKLVDAMKVRAGARYVVRFDIMRGNVHVYSVFFATKHATGCDRMKKAFWKADALDGRAFRSRHREALSLPLARVDLPAFGAEIMDASPSWSTPALVDQVDAWAKTDATQFHSGHVRGALKLLEADGRLLVPHGGAVRRKGTFPPGTALQFAVPQQRAA